MKKTKIGLKDIADAHPEMDYRLNPQLHTEYILIIENKDTFYDIRRYISQTGSILGKEFDTVIYGAGKGIWSTFADYVNQAEEYFGADNRLYYFGDLDYEGILIYEHIVKGNQIQIYDKIHGIASKREYADEYFKKTFDSLLVQTKQPLYLSQQFEINRISYENQLEKLKIDLAEMDQEQKNIEVREVPITWAQVSANSGGEGFLSAFVVLSCLLSYMRRDETDLFSNGEEGKVLIMDNPFAQTNAEHLLKPLMEMAKKTNTQLICLSGLGGDSIYNRFDNIYVLKLVDSGIRKGVQRIESRHIKGDGIREVVLSANRVKQI